MSGARWKIRWLVATALCAFAASATPASADAPLEGHWRFGQGGTTIEFHQTSSGHFAGTIRNADGTTNCPGNVNGVQVTGSGTHYTGTNRFYFTDPCQLVGNGNVDITLSDDGLSGTYKGDPPPSASCCSETIAMSRDPVATQPDLPALVNSILVDLQKRYRKIVKSGKSKPKGQLKALGAAARAGRSKLEAYKANSNEKTLKTCAINGLKTVESGAKVKTERAGKGLSAIAKCLKGYASDLPNGRAGTPPPPGAKPGGAVLDGHYVGANGSGKKAGSFSLDVKSGFVGNFAFSLWTPARCNGGRGDGFSPFDTPQKKALNSDGSFTYTLSDGDTTINIQGLISGGRGSGTMSVSFASIPQCSSGTIPWSVARR
jgi:hypothetical protein